MCDRDRIKVINVTKINQTPKKMKVVIAYNHKSAKSELNNYIYIYNKNVIIYILAILIFF